MFEKKTKRRNIMTTEKNQFTIEIGYQRERTVNYETGEQGLTFDITRDMNHTNIFVDSIAHAKKIAKAIGSPYFMICRANDSWREEPVYISTLVRKARLELKKSREKKELDDLKREKAAVKRINEFPKVKTIYCETYGAHKVEIKVKHGVATLETVNSRGTKRMTVDYEFVVLIDGKKNGTPDTWGAHDVSMFTDYITSDGKVRTLKFINAYGGELGYLGNSAHAFAGDIKFIAQEIKDWKVAFTSTND